MAFKPLADRILVKAEQEKTSSIIQGISSKPPTKGVVITVGPGEPLEDGTVRPMEVRVGDIVTFSGFSDVPTISDDDHGDLLILKESDIIAIIR